MPTLAGYATFRERVSDCLVELYNNLCIFILKKFFPADLARCRGGVRIKVAWNRFAGMLRSFSRRITAFTAISYPQSDLRYVDCISSSSIVPLAASYVSTVCVEARSESKKKHFASASTKSLCAEHRFPKGQACRFQVNLGR